MPTSRCQVQPPEVVKGGRGGGAASEDEHGHGAVVIHGRVRVPLGDLVPLLTLAAAR